MESTWSRIVVNRLNKFSKLYVYRVYRTKSYITVGCCRKEASHGVNMLWGIRSASVYVEIVEH